MSDGEDRSRTDAGPLYLGLDVGSVSVDTVVIDAAGQVLFSRYSRTKGRPLVKAAELLAEVYDRFGRESFAAGTATGSGAGTVGPLIGAAPVNEIIAATRGAAAVHPEARSIIDMGGEDAKLILTAPGADGGLTIEDFAMNTMCAAGTGSFLDQQSHRLQLTIEEFSHLALESPDPPRLAGRCSVFAKSDMIHLQQAATPDYDIVAGLCFAVARNLKSNIAKGKKVTPPVCFIGGVAANHGVRRAIVEVMEIEPHELLVPEDFGCIGALGAALTARDRGEAAPLADLAALRERAGQAKARAGRLPRLKLGGHHRDDLLALEVPAGPLEGYLGVDVGSISTNVVVIDPEGKLLSKQYLLTAGRPLEAVKEGLRRVGEEIGDRLTVLGAGTTGSGRYLTADFIGADVVRNEITAQATAAAAIDPEVETIFEIGGQDSKFIALKDGAIVDFMMNKVCAAGTGSFLEEQAEKLGIAIKGEFGQKALDAPNPVRLGERCTVFMESDLVAHQAAGEEIDDLVAGLSYSIVQNYLNMVVENRPIGKKIFYQGATAANQGIVAAFESVLGRPIVVPPHHDVTGAIGAALLAMRERDWEASRFKGFAASQAPYSISTFECSGCPNACAIRKVKVEGEKRPLFYGSRCEKYELGRASEASEEAIPDLVAEREELLMSYLAQPPAGAEGAAVGIPRAMFMRELMPFFGAFLAELGIPARASGVTTKQMIHKGVEAVVNEPCFPVKVAHGHLRDLMDQGVERIFYPAVVNLAAPGHELGYGHVCPYAQTLPYTAPAALDLTGAGVELVSAPVRFGYGRSLLKKDLRELARRLGVSSGVGRALEAGLAAQEDFYRRLQARGREVLAAMGSDQRGLVIVSRPYNGGDPGLNLGLPRKMRSLGVWPIPMDYLDMGPEMGDPEVGGMYWRFGQKIMAAGRIARRDPRLYAVYITNFGCGPDSFIEHFFMAEHAGKPFLQIEIDEHSADAGVITRLEAFLDSLDNAPVSRPQAREVRARSLETRGRTIYMPPMSDHAVGVAAAFRACGAGSVVLPESDQRSVELGRQYTSGKECYPCALTTGDMLKVLLDDGVDPDQVAFFMPSGTGPCRFGQYNRYHRLALDRLGYEDVPIYSPDQSDKFYQELGMVGGSDFVRLAWQGVVAVDILLKALHEKRPYEAEPGAADRIYQRYLELVGMTVAQRGDLAELMAAAADEFAALALNGSGPRPLVGVVGEIYTRANRFANEEVVRAIEDLGGQAWLPPVGEWILYVNYIAARRARTLGNWKGLLGTKIKDYFQHKDERALGRPWQRVLATLEEPSIATTLARASRYIDPMYEGEACLSLGKSADMQDQGAAGLVNILPFGCMPGNIVNAVMKRFREDHQGLPFLPLAMDGQEQSGHRIRLEAFMHQVRQYHDRRAA